MAMVPDSEHLNLTSLKPIDRWWKAQRVLFFYSQNKKPLSKAEGF
jgi:hypothetical protein